MNQQLDALRREIEAGEFTPTYAAPNGTAQWIIFGSDGDRGTETRRGPRRIVAGLTPEIHAIIPDLVEEWFHENGLGHYFA